MTSAEKIAYLKSIFGLKPAGLQLAVTLNGKENIEDFFRIAITGKIPALLDSVNLELQKTLESQAKQELKAEISRVEKRLDGLKKQLGEIKNG